MAFAPPTMEATNISAKSFTPVAPALKVPIGVISKPAVLAVKMGVRLICVELPPVVGPEAFCSKLKSLNSTERLPTVMVHPVAPSAW